MTAVERCLLRAYPPSFRDRYGAELAQLVQDLDRPGRVDLLRGVARAWMAPPIGCDATDRARRQLAATLGTTWVAWCVAGLLLPFVDRWLHDPLLATPVNSAAGPRHLLAAADVSFAVGALALVLGAAWLGARVALPVLRRRPRTFAPLLLPGGLLVFEVCAGVLLSVLARGHTDGWAHPSVAFLLTLAVGILGAGLLVAMAGWAPPVVLRRLRPSSTDLVIGAAIAAVAAGALVVVLVLVELAAVSAGASGLAATASVVAAPAVLPLLVSTGRGRGARRALVGAG